MSAKADLSDAAVAAVLGRAAEIDSRGRIATPDDLVQWAGEAGISAEAVEAALLEFQTPPARELRRVRNALTALAAGVGGVIAGAFVRIVASDPLLLDRGLNAVAPWAVGIAVVGTLALSKTRSIRDRFQIINVLVWGCYVSGWSIANGVATEDITLLGLIAGISTAIAGGVAKYVVKRRTSGPNQPHRGP